MLVCIHAAGLITPKSAGLNMAMSDTPSAGSTHPGRL